MQLVDEGDSFLARKLLVKVLPNENDFIKCPYVVEAESVLRNAHRYNSGTFSGHTDNVNSALFSPDGKYIVTSSSDETAKLWEFQTLQEIIDKVSAQFKNNPLTDEERREYYLE